MKICLIRYSDTDQHPLTFYSDSAFLFRYSNQGSQPASNASLGGATGLCGNEGVGPAWDSIPKEAGQPEY